MRLTRRRAGATAAVVVMLALIGWAVRGAPPGTGTPAGAATPVPVEEETPGVSDPTAGPPPASGTGRDPLTPAELARARAIAVDPALIADTADVTGAPGPEYLSFELAEPATGGAAGPRRAALYYYDYAADQLIKRVVDLSAGRLEASFAAAQMQPPASPREVTAALALLLADPAGELLRSRYADATGAPLPPPDELQVNAQVFVADPGTPGDAGRCGRHRCLILLPRPSGGRFIDLSDIIIDLSGRSVVRPS